MENKFEDKVKKLLSAIKKSEQDGECEIYEQAEEHITAHYEHFDQTVTFRLVPPTKEGLHDMFFWGKDCDEERDLWSNLLVSAASQLDPSYFIYLRHVCFVSSNEDIDQMKTEIGTTEETPEQLRFEFDDDPPLSFAWVDPQTAVINVAAIRNAINDLEIAYPFGFWERHKAYVCSMLYAIKAVSEFCDPYKDKPAGQKEIAAWARNIYKYLYGDN